MKRILVTGGCGVIGSHLVDALLAKGYGVTVIDNLSTGIIKNIEHNLGNPNFQFINDTIINHDLMERAIRECSTVYHLAAAVGVKYICDDPLLGILTNVKGTEIVLEMAYKHWKRVVFASTSEIYGKSEDVPFREDSQRVLGPTSIDRWSYSTSKALDEHLCFAYSKKGLPVSIVRYFNCYGPRIDEKGYGSVVANFISQAFRGAPMTVHGDGRQTRCFTFVDDTVAGTILVGESPEAIGEVFNIGNTVETSIRELAEMIKELTGSDSEIKSVSYESAYGNSYEDTRRRVPATEKAKETIGFEPKVDLSKGLKKTIEWAKENYKLSGAA